ncbi:MAG: hypothetical protein CVV27_16760 [Candidatus Melainabacteria bacterium HGW-Melainabacteria-1]|nr:MAG: hypothetical protein CVV27_16760 [Candidatus Melainabacteria bacterium HGW-Melainabacteria-1]
MERQAFQPDPLKQTVTGQKSAGQKSAGPNPADQNQDQILVTVALGQQEGEQLLSRDAFLDQYPGTWQTLLGTGMAKYICADRQVLSEADGLRMMKVFVMCRNVRQRVAERMVQRLGEIKPPTQPTQPRRAAAGCFPAA